MHIYGPSNVHGPHPIQGPHQARQSGSAPSVSRQATAVDELQLSDNALAAADARELPGIRQERIANIRQQIAAGTYETPEKLEVSVARLLDEIG